VLTALGGPVEAVEEHDYSRRLVRAGWDCAINGCGRVSLLVRKLLALFVHPLGAAVLLGLAAVALVLAGRPLFACAVLAVALTGLWIASTPAFSYRLTARLQAGFPPPDDLAKLPPADVVIVLGGITARSGSTGSPVLSGSADRLFRAVRLCRAGNAPRIIVCGGHAPWSANDVSEAVLIANLLLELGVPSDALVLETKSRDTHESVANIKAMFAARGWTSGLLVTSATHMRRALATFRRAGLCVTPAASDVHGRIQAVESPLDLLPDADALARTTIAVKEILGIWAYRLRGWA
jgi:uncharacterized SAM-binding protein YcdF (DUF218 family)